MNKDIKTITDKELIAEGKRLQKEIQKHDAKFIDRLKKDSELQKLMLTIGRA